jgi:predicted nuclease of predicted toxin-antitoxin system
MGRGEPFKTGDVEIVDLGSGEGDIIITQDKPLITEVTGIFGKVAGREV